MEQWQENLQSKALEMETLIFSYEAKEFDKNERSIKHWVSKTAEDRGGDVVLPDVFDLKNYKKNPIVLFNHHPFYPIGHSMWLNKEKDGMLAKTQFATTPFADDIYQLNVEKVLNAWSIGFIPRKHEFDEKNKVTTFTDIELLEYSNVSIPMNQDAVTEGLKMVKSQLVKNILTEAKDNLEVKSLLGEMKSEIEGLKKLNDNIMNDSQSYSLKDGEKLEREMLELRNKINSLAGTSGNEKVLKSILDQIRSGDVSKK